MKSEFEIAITQLSADRNLSPQIILDAIESALVSAYKRNYGSNQNASVHIDPHTGQAKVFVKKLVVQDATDEATQVTLREARLHKTDAEIGDFVDIEVKPRNFGRIAAQTAKQVITQRIREAERDSVYIEYADRVGEIVNGIVRNVDARTNDVVLSLGKAEVLLPHNEQIPHERYRFNQRLRVYIIGVDRAGHGPQIKVSRTHPDLLRRLLELEVPEIFNGIVEIRAIAREPGFRSKVAVHATQQGVDPVGSCVGMRGVRIRNIVNELNGEKIDVVSWSSDMRTFIANALSPAKVVDVHLFESDKTATVVVPERSLSLAIGKEGQNARLAAKLTGWRIDIKSEEEAAVEAERLTTEREEAERRAKERGEARRAAAELLAQAEAAMAAEEAAEQEAELEVEDVVKAAEPSVADTSEILEQIGDEEELAWSPTPVSEEPATSSEAERGEAAEIVPQEAEAEPAVAELAYEQAVKAEEIGAEEAGAEEAGAEEAGAEEAVAKEAVAKEAVVEDQVAEEESTEAQPEPADESDEAEEMDVEHPEPSKEWAEEETLEDDDSSDSRKKGRRRDRRLEYDEQLGRVVARKRRKPSRHSWEDSWRDGNDE
jgi:transcription termination/antitermination protein NusA